MNTIFRTTAYRNALKQPAGSFYYLRVRSRGCLDIDGIIGRIDRLPFVISSREYAFLVNIFLGPSASRPPPAKPQPQKSRPDLSAIYTVCASAFPYGAP